MAASEAKGLGHGGVTLVSRACGLSRKAITKGIREIEAGTPLAPGRIRRPGGGRKPITVSDPQLLEALERLIEPDTRGDPQSPLRWTCKSTRAIARALAARQHPVNHATVAQLLHDLDFSLQSTRKTEEGEDHPDRDAQFRYINRTVKRYLTQQLPVISADTKRKELIGNYANTGQQWRPTRQPHHVQGHDFPRRTCRARIRLGFTTSAATTGLSTSAPITTQASLPWRPSADGGATKDADSIPGRVAS